MSSEDARKQATTILDQAHARANEIVAEGKADGVKERERQLAAAKAEVEQETNRAREELRGQVSAIAVLRVQRKFCSAKSMAKLMKTSWASWRQEL